MMKTVVKLKGIFRIQLWQEEQGKQIKVGDSKWKENQVTNLGFQTYILNNTGSLGGGVTVAYCLIGTGTVPGAADTSLHGSTVAQTVGNAVVSSKTLRATAAIASGQHPGGTPTIQNIALVNTPAGTIMCGNTYTTSAWQSNQALSITYDLRFATA